jgi:ABC-2 type transport system permease protein
MSIVALHDAYPNQASLDARGTLMKNPAAVVMTGPDLAGDHYTFGAMVATELVLYLLIAAAIMSIILVVRHTRADEEEGRLEMLRSLATGRWAAPVAALATVAIADLGVGLATTVGVLTTGMPAADSVGLGLATALTGLVFGAIGAVAAQVTEHARTASSLGIGDVIEPTGSALSWFSPLAWAQQMRPFIDIRFWPMVLSAAAVVLLLLLAAALAHRRDLGAGLVPARPGAPEASRLLTTPTGLALRLVTGSFVGWAIGLGLFGLAFGALAGEIDDMMGANPELAQWIEIDLDDLSRSFVAVMLAMLALGPVALVVSGILRLRAEERLGRMESLLVAGTRRHGLLLGWSWVVLAEAVALQVVVGTGLGVGTAIALSDPSWIGTVALASLAFVPAIAVFAGLAVAVIGVAPRLSSVAWALVGWAAVVVILGELLGLPQWARDVSPLEHTPLVPQEEWGAAVLGLQVAVAAVLVVAGVVGVRRRDVPAR